MAQEVIKIRGGRTLNGEVNISGAKNSAVAIIPATLLAQGHVKLEGLPQISDVKTLVSLLEDLNIKASLNGTELEVDTTEIQNAALPNNKVESLRASYYMMGAMLGRFKKCVIGLPGGCPLGPRPIDQHIKGFKALGAEIDESSTTSMKIEAKELKGAHIFLDMVSVGATIKINGVKELHGSEYQVIPDRIEAGTYMCIAAACGENVILNNIVPKHVETLTAKFSELGVNVDVRDERIRINNNAPYRFVDIKTLVYPGFATDLQQPITPLLFMANGPSFVTDTIYPERFKHVEELKRMGANIEVDEGTATIKPSTLHDAEVYASDLRAGACLIIAGLIAEGVTTIYNVKHIYRGYTDIVEHLKALGADIWTETV
ncbi:TPA: UDP-N-acetylglucosamine 1-carboxyvinyltransferase [Staphylococcus aureus]|nr:UDP-N-acetylglucosamine 1-carboxyvinyltransferase [Staphylococcus aureus]